MRAHIFDGRKFADLRISLAKERIKDNPELSKGKLRVILIGDNQASIVYIKLKSALFSSLGLSFEDIYFQTNDHIQKIVDYINESNRDQGVKAVMVQLPFPESWTRRSKKLVLKAISPRKDVDCLTPENLKLVSKDEGNILPATVKAVKLTLKSAGVDKITLAKLNTCVLGKSDLVGRPLARLLSSMGARVVTCDSKTKDIPERTRKSDIIISATGVPELIKKDMIKPGAIVIDVGEPKGDVDFNFAKNIASFITPVPGGIGPVTVACLLENFLSL